MGVEGKQTGTEKIELTFLVTVTGNVLRHSSSLTQWECETKGISNDGYNLFNESKRGVST